MAGMIESTVFVKERVVALVVNDFYERCLFVVIHGGAWKVSRLSRMCACRVTRNKER